MKKLFPSWALALIALITAGLACQFLSPGEPNPTVPPTQAPGSTPVPAKPTQPPVATQAAPDATQTQTTPIDSPFPLPNDVQNFTRLNQDQINFQTNMSMDEVIAFYREAFAKQGLKEWELLTTIDEKGFSLVFQGGPNGKEVVLQGVDLGNNTTNVNIRYEDV